MDMIDLFLMNMIDHFPLALKIIFICILMVLKIVCIGILVSWLLEKAFGDGN